MSLLQRFLGGEGLGQNIVTALSIILGRNPYVLSIINDQNELVSKAPVGRLEYIPG